MNEKQEKHYFYRIFTARNSALLWFIEDNISTCFFLLFE
jgi:hypothetical protein